MHIFQNLFYIIKIVLALIIFSIPKNLAADDMLINLNATAKHYCTCIFISNLDSDSCDEAYDRIIYGSINNYELVDQIKIIGHEVDLENNSILIDYNEYNIRVKFTNETGCYFTK